MAQTPHRCTLTTAPVGREHVLGVAWLRDGLQRCVFSRWRRSSTARFRCKWSSRRTVGDAMYSALRGRFPVSYDHRATPASATVVAIRRWGLDRLGTRRSSLRSLASLRRRCGLPFPALETEETQETEARVGRTSPDRRAGPTSLATWYAIRADLPTCTTSVMARYNHGWERAVANAPIVSASGLRGMLLGLFDDGGGGGGGRTSGAKTGTAVHSHKDRPSRYYGD